MEKTPLRLFKKHHIENAGDAYKIPGSPLMKVRRDKFRTYFIFFFNFKLTF